MKTLFFVARYDFDHIRLATNHLACRADFVQRGSSMQPKQLAGYLVTAALVAAGPLVAMGADQPEHDMHRQHLQHDQGAMQPAPTDTRPLVQLPEQMRLHMLSNMRDHLLALQQIQDALANERLD